MQANAKVSQLSITATTDSAASSTLATTAAPGRHLHLTNRVAAASTMWAAPAAGDSDALTTDQIRAATPAPRALDESIEASLIATIMRPLAPEETHVMGNANKERELCALLSTLTVTQAFDLGRRLDAGRDGDAVVVAFRRLAADRRLRVRGYIADARRRAALGRG